MTFGPLDVDHTVDLIALLVALVALITLFGVLFGTLILVREARDRWSSKFIWSSHRYQKRNYNVRDTVSKLIREAEERFSIALTSAAREMLIIPVEEAYEMSGGINFGEVQESIMVLVEAVRYDESLSAIGYGPSQMRTAQSVIRAFYSRFCKIPPFCDGSGR